ncbi:hypothetical protein OY671_011239, partial [Metschnikowia pulcherrima]
GDNSGEGASESSLRALRGASGRVRRCASMCTGAFVSAQAGSLDGRRATTHWFYARRSQREYPQVKVDEDRIFVADGPIWTSAGMSAGIDSASVSFAGPGKRDAESEAAIARGVTLNLESEGEAERASAIAERSGRTPRLAIRANPDFDLKGSGMKMGGGAKPFG